MTYIFIIFHNNFKLIYVFLHQNLSVLLTLVNLCISFGIFNGKNKLKLSNHGLLLSKSRLSSKDLSAPKLEFVAIHIANNILKNARIALQKLLIKSFYGWSNSMEGFTYWWKVSSKYYEQLVAVRNDKINEKCLAYWRHVPSQENSAVLGTKESRGGSNGPKWLVDPV